MQGDGRHRQFYQRQLRHRRPARQQERRHAVGAQVEGITLQITEGEAALVGIGRGRVVVESGQARRVAGAEAHDVPVQVVLVFGVPDDPVQLVEDVGAVTAVQGDAWVVAWSHLPPEVEGGLAPRSAAR